MLNSCWEVIDIRGSYCRGHYGDYYGDCCGDYYEAYYGACYKDCWWVKISFIDLAYYTSYSGTVGVRGDILVLK